jgi:chromosome segregation ATPase
VRGERHFARADRRQDMSRPRDAMPLLRCARNAWRVAWMRRVRARGARASGRPRTIAPPRGRLSRSSARVSESRARVSESRARVSESRRASRRVVHLSRGRAHASRRVVHVSRRRAHVSRRGAHASRRVARVSRRRARALQKSRTCLGDQREALQESRTCLGDQREALQESRTCLGESWATLREERGLCDQESTRVRMLVGRAAMARLTSADTSQRDRVPREMWLNSVPLELRGGGLMSSNSVESAGDASSS